MIRPFVHNRINEMLVSKKFFVAAARAYVANQTWEDSLDEHICQALHEEGGIVYAWASTINTRCVLLRLRTHLPNLRDVTVTLDEWVWEDADYKFAWEERYSEEELKRGYLYQELSELRGLRKFEIVAGGHESARSKRQLKKWRQNCRAFEALLKPILTRPKFAAPELPESNKSCNPTPLYPGCAVTFDTSELRRIGADCEIDYGLQKLYEAKGDEIFDSELMAISQKSAADVKDLREMLFWNGEKMLEWIRDAKRRTGLPPSKTGLTVVEEVELVQPASKKRAENVVGGKLEWDTLVLLGAASVLVLTWMAWLLMAVTS
ncbi:hypothetical protein LTR85_002060 [Meristemomyces frigidus]|nr:hypothetical protein LTR85_002060 [Meristemomyces frigidus]